MTDIEKWRKGFPPISSKVMVETSNVKKLNVSFSNESQKLVQFSQEYNLIRQQENLGSTLLYNLLVFTLMR